MVNNDFINSIQSLHESRKLIFRLLDTFPCPVEIFSLDGTTVLVNQAFLELHGIPDSALVVGKYNILEDPFCSGQIENWISIQKAFSGETISIQNFKFPVQNYVELGIIKEKPYESVIMDAHFSTLSDDEKFGYVLCVLFVKNIYWDNPVIAKAKKYLDIHWQAKFDPKALAKSVNISVNQVYQLFNRHIGETPGYYYKKRKVEHIKGKLADKNLSIKEVFAACGENSQGRMARVFKNITGLSPTAYRKSIWPL